MFDRHIADALPVTFEAFHAVPATDWSSVSFRLLWTARLALEFNAEQRTAAVPREQILLVKPGVSLRLLAPNPPLVRCLAFRSPLLDTFPFSTPFLTLNIGALGKRLLALMHSYRERPIGEGDRLRLSSLLFSLLCESFLGAEAAEPHRWTAPAKPVQRKKSGLPIVYAVRYMRKHMSNPDLSLQEIAGAVGYNPNYFCQEFSQIFGVSPIRHLKELRLNRALQYLENGDEPVKRICERVGIRNPGNFTSMVKQKIGMTPLEYRRSRRTRAMDDNL